MHLCSLMLFLIFLLGSNYNVRVFSAILFLYTCIQWLLLTYTPLNFLVDVLLLLSILLFHCVTKVRFGWKYKVIAQVSCVGPILASIQCLYPTFYPYPIHTYLLDVLPLETAIGLVYATEVNKSFKSISLLSCVTYMYLYNLIEGYL